MSERLKCSSCGSDNVTRQRGTYEFSESGLKIVLHGIEIEKCGTCGNGDPLIPRMNDLMRAIALRLIAKPYALGGKEVRFLRKYLGMTGDQFSRLIHVDSTTLSKWENDHDKLGQQSDLLIRSVALALGDGLRSKMTELVRHFEQVAPKKKAVKVEITANPETEQYEYA